MVKNILEDIRLFIYALKLQLKNAAALKTAFIIQIVGMMVNNILLISAWYFLFHRFGNINGWNFSDYLGLSGFSMLFFSIIMLLNTGIMELPKYVDQGSLDNMLTRPMPLLLNIASSSIDQTAIGDLILSFLLIFWYLSSASLSLSVIIFLIIGILIGLILFWCFAILIPNTLAFYFNDSEKVSRNVGMIFIDTGIYPTGIIKGPLRTFLLLFFPGLFIGSIQIELILKANYMFIILGVFVAIFWLTFSLWFFRRSVRKYESSNLIGSR